MTSDEFPPEYIQVGTHKGVPILMCWDPHKPNKLGSHWDSDNPHHGKFCIELPGGEEKHLASFKQIKDALDEKLPGVFMTAEYESAECVFSAGGMKSHSGSYRSIYKNGTLTGRQKKNKDSYYKEQTFEIKDEHDQVYWKDTRNIWMGPEREKIMELANRMYETDEAAQEARDAYYAFQKGKSLHDVWEKKE